ncbi:MAG: hypothetical protein ACOH5I_21355 [Oligoflexus sp.]
MKACYFSIFAMALASTVVSCGSSDEKKPAPVIIYGELQATGAGATASESFSLTQAACSNNSETGLFSASLVGEQTASLEIRIKGFSTTGQSYTCTQAADNQEGSVGQRFNACMVEFSVPDEEDGMNTYAMHRSSDTDKNFTYEQACSVTTEYTEPNVTVSVSCVGMIQTKFQGAVRNPIDTSVTGSVNSETSFTCAI